MKKTLLLATAMVALSCSYANAADLNPYVSAKFLYSNIKADVKENVDIPGLYTGVLNEKANDNVFGTSIAFGLSNKLQHGDLRTELELNIRQEAEKTYHDSGDTWKNSVEAHSLMINLYYDFDTGTKFNPYFVGGIGLARVEGKVDDIDESYSKKATNFAWQLGAGVAYALTDNISIDAGYRYTDMGDVTKTISGPGGYAKMSFDVTAHEFLLGVRYKF